MAAHRFWRTWTGLSTAAALVAAILVALFHWTPGPTAGIASAVSDSLYRFHHRQPHPDIVFVAIDHEAVKAVGRWPWPRDTLARGIDKLTQAKVLVLDMVFSEPTEPERDAALGEAFAQAPTVGGLMFNGLVPSQPDDAAMAILANSSLTEVATEHPLIESQVIELSVPPILQGQSLVGVFNTLPDKDNRFRHYPVAFRFQNMALPSLGVQSLQIALNQMAALTGKPKPALTFGERTIALNERSFTRLNFYPEERFQLLSFAKLLEPSFDERQLAGKIVILGVTEAGVTDIRATPLGQYPGPLLHATFMANVLDDANLSEFSTGQMATIIIACLLLTLAIARANALYLRALLYLALAAAAYGASVGLYLWGNWWLESAYLIAGVWLTAILIESALLSQSKAHAEMLRTAFSTYLPPTLVNRIVASPDQLNLGGEAKELTVLFSDIRGFTSLSESVTAEELAGILAIYFQPMTEAIFAQEGTLDKYIGDAIMAFFNAPLDQPDHALAACKAAIAMQYAQERINERLTRDGRPSIRTGIGINTGPAIVGNLGSSIRFNYTAIGDTVNLASRLESATKKVCVDIVIGETTHAQLQGRLPCRPLDDITVVGKEAPQKIFELCWREVPDPGTRPATEA